LIALAAGTVLAGIVGAVLSVPLTAAAWAVVKVWTDRDNSDAVDDAKKDIEAKANPEDNKKSLDSNDSLPEGAPRGAEG
jgi:hypothetical protein